MTYSEKRCNLNQDYIDSRRVPTARGYIIALPIKIPPRQIKFTSKWGNESFNFLAFLRKQIMFKNSKLTPSPSVRKSWIQPWEQVALLSPRRFSKFIYQSIPHLIIHDYITVKIFSLAPPSRTREQQILKISPKIMEIRSINLINK